MCNTSNIYNPLENESKCVGWPRYNIVTMNKPKPTLQLSKYTKVYLAIPYSGIEEESYKVANHVCSMLFSQDILVYSPISHCHKIATDHGLPGHYEFWKKLDDSFIDWCDIVMVVNIGGDQRGIELIHNSKGVQGEISYAKSIEKQVIFYCYE